MATLPSVSSLVWGVMVPLTVFALGAGPQADVPGVPAPTAIEQALVERACSATGGHPISEDVRQQCFSVQLVALRADFGRDLSRLTASDRKRIDAACSRLREAEQREAYLGCLGGQLAALCSRDKRGRSAASTDTAAVLSDLAGAPSQPARQTSSLSATWMGGGAVASVLVGAGAFLATRSRRRRVCRTCGAAVRDADLCATCRHDAAEAQRRAAAERMDAQRAQEMEIGRKREREAEQEQARIAREARAREPELPTRPMGAASQPQAPADVPRRSVAAPMSQEPAASVAAEAFDPYAVLGVARDTGEDGIRDAYERAKAKYDPALAPTLAYAVRAHLVAKTQSIEQAYQMLSGSQLLQRGAALPMK